MTLTNVTVSGNSAPNSGGIENLGTATLTGVTVSGNTSQGSEGLNSSIPGIDAGIGNYGQMVLTNCTVSGNSDGLIGGGIGNHGAMTWPTAPSPETPPGAAWSLPAM